MTTPRTVFIPVPDTDFDVTEVSVPWKLLVEAGHNVVFLTEHGGKPPAADPLLLSGVIFGQLGADPEPKRFYAELSQTRAFQEPMPWSALDPGGADALLLPGGHAPGMRQYLGNTQLQDRVAKFFESGKPVAAICHGVLLAARSKGHDGKSVLAQRRTTCLPKYMERTAYFLTAWKLGRYYRTYPLYVEDEVKLALAQESQFERGPRTLSKRGTRADDAPAFTVEDGQYVSARWPGDAYLFGKQLLARL
ncbi:MAG: DJ-1/PfpI family protein [Deltaproteobacteria bacterium]|nr:DJ-1/PfpI family protein [Deltaproteobacteria bacterium]